MDNPHEINIKNEERVVRNSSGMVVAACDETGKSRFCDVQYAEDGRVKEVVVQAGKYRWLLLPDGITYAEIDLKPGVKVDEKDWVVRNVEFDQENAVIYYNDHFGVPRAITTVSCICIDGMGHDIGCTDIYSIMIVQAKRSASLRQACNELKDKAESEGKDISAPRDVSTARNEIASAMVDGLETEVVPHRPRLVPLGFVRGSDG